MGVAEPPARWKEKSGRVASFFRAGGKPTPVFTIWNVADMYGIDTDTLYEYVTSDRQVMYYRNNHNGR